MKRCSAIAIARAIKELRRAEKNAGVWSEILRLDQNALAKILLFTENYDLLDARSIAQLEQELPSQPEATA